MPDPQSVSPGEVGGILAGVIGAFVALGHGVRWAINWGDARATSRSAKLQAWHEELEEREAKLDAEIEQRFRRIEAQNVALHAAFRHVASALIHADPQNPAIMQAEQMLATAFPLDLSMLGLQAGAAIDAVPRPPSSGRST